MINLLGQFCYFREEIHQGALRLMLDSTKWASGFQYDYNDALKEMLVSTIQNLTEELKNLK